MLSPSPVPPACPQFLPKRLADLDLERAEATLSLRTVASPVAAVVMKWLRHPGELATKEQPIVRPAHLDPLRVEVFVPIALYGRGLSARSSSRGCDTAGCIDETVFSSGIFDGFTGDGTARTMIFELPVGVPFSVDLELLAISIGPCRVPVVARARRGSRITVAVHHQSGIRAQRS